MSLIRRYKYPQAAWFHAPRIVLSVGQNSHVLCVVDVGFQVSVLHERKNDEGHFAPVRERDHRQHVAVLEALHAKRLLQERLDRLVRARVLWKCHLHGNTIHEKTC